MSGHVLSLLLLIFYLGIIVPGYLWITRPAAVEPERPERGGTTCPTHTAAMIVGAVLGLLFGLMLGSLL